MLYPINLYNYYISIKTKIYTKNKQKVKSKQKNSLYTQGYWLFLVPKAREAWSCSINMGSTKQSWTEETPINLTWVAFTFHGFHFILL